MANVANLTEASGPVTVVRSTHGRAVMRISFIEFFERGRPDANGHPRFWRVEKLRCAAVRWDPAFDRLERG